jgi:hypothetical protein
MKGDGVQIDKDKENWKKTQRHLSYIKMLEILRIEHIKEC